MRISYSSIETFRNCPLKYRFQEIDKIRVPKSKEALFGTVLHQTLKFFYGQSPIVPTIEQVLSYYRKTWPKEIKEKAFWNQGLKMLKDYYLKNSPSNTNIIDLETYFEIPMSIHTLCGKIDRIDKINDQRFEIIDYKTTKRLPAQRAVDNDLQLSIYHLALKDRWPQIPQTKLSLYFLKHGLKLSSKRTQAQIDQTKKHILKIISEIEKSNFRPMPSPLCDWCGYQKYCPMFKHLFLKPKIKNQKQIEKIIKEYLSLQSKISQQNKRLAEIKKMINDYCDEKRIERIYGKEAFITRLFRKRPSYKVEEKEYQTLVVSKPSTKNLVTAKH